jgi:hypothetical protein
MKTKKKKGKGIASDELNGESALGGDAMSMLSLREIPWAPGSAGAVAVRGGEGGVVEIVDSEDEDGEGEGGGGAPPPAPGTMLPPPATSRLPSAAPAPTRPAAAARCSLALPPTFAPHHLTSSRYSLALPTSSPSPLAFRHRTSTTSPSPINGLRPSLAFPPTSPSSFLGHTTRPSAPPSPSTADFGNHHHQILPRHHHGRFYSTANIPSFVGQRTRSENTSRDGLPPARMSFGGGGV